MDSYTYSWSHRREEREGIANVFEEIMVVNFSNLGKNLDVSFQGAQRTSTERKLKSYTLRHIIIKLSKVKHKQRFLKQ